MTFGCECALAVYILANGGYVTYVPRSTITFVLAIVSLHVIMFIVSLRP